MNAQADRWALTIEPIALAPPAPAPLVSVIMANYNYAAYLPQAIESVLAQTYPNFQLVICDDGSTDASWETIERYRRRDRRIVAIRQPNGGMASALNAAFARSTGEIICLLDSDDWFVPRKLETVVAGFENHPQAGFLMHALHRVDAAGQRRGIQPLLQRADSGWYGPAALRRGGGALGWGAPCSGICVRRPVAERTFPIPQSFRKNADGVVSGLAIFMTPLVAISDPLGMWREHGANLTTTSNITSEWTAEQMTVIRNIWNAQRSYLEGVSPELAAALVSYEAHPWFRQLAYIYSRLRPGAGVMATYRTMLEGEGFAEGTAFRRSFWRASIALPRPLFLRAVRMVCGQGRLKQGIVWMTRRPHPAS
jgi:glycosyltransferase involved in cell wall biosynthesis